MNIKEYFSSLFKGAYSLIQGMEVTGRELFTKKVTEQYPENRATLQIADRFRGTLKFIYDDEGYHKCIACKSCERNCPNGTIQVITKMVEQPDGKKKMRLDRYMYDLGSCTFCNLCVLTCPTNAIEFSNDFEQAVFSRDVLVKQLNYLPEKEKPASVKPSPAKPAEPKAKPAAKTETPAKQDEANKPVDTSKKVESNAPADHNATEKQIDGKQMVDKTTNDGTKDKE